jgi:hypothetical protein
MTFCSPASLAGHALPFTRPLRKGSGGGLHAADEGDAIYTLLVVAPPSPFRLLCREYTENLF